MSLARFFRTSTVWVVDFTYDGHPRRWLKALPQAADGPAAIAAELGDLYGTRARLLEVRRASPQEELQYIRGDLPKNMFCPTGRAPVRRT
jgi:hypothetical protein